MIVQEPKSRNIYVGVYGQSYDSSNKMWSEDYYLLPLVPLVGVTQLRIRWEHTVGEYQGLTVTFLQPWYNKPVSITIQGESYIGAFGGTGIAEALRQQQQQAEKLGEKLNKLRDNILNGITKSFKTNLAKAKNVSSSTSTTATTTATSESSTTWNKWRQQVNNFLNKTANSAANLVEKWKTLQKISYGPLEDGTVNNLKDSISYFNYGPTKLPADLQSIRNVRHVLLIENEKGLGNEQESFSIFEGFISSLEYEESIESPFIYSYSFEFTGMPQTGAIVRNATETGKFDKSRPGVILSLTDGAFQLRQGLGL